MADGPGGGRKFDLSGIRLRPDPIEAESMRTIMARTDLSHLSAPQQMVVCRIVHASADLDFATDVVCPLEAVEAGVEALLVGAPIVADVGMVAAGIWGDRALTWVKDPRAVAVAEEHGTTRTAAAIRLAVDEVGPGAVYVVGCAPTALAELLAVASQARPALVVGLPVGFVGAVDSKAILRASGLPQISNRGEKGGSGVAAAAANALLRLAAQRQRIVDPGPPGYSGEP